MRTRVHSSRLRPSCVWGGPSPRVVPTLVRALAALALPLASASSAAVVVPATLTLLEAPAAAQTAPATPAKPKKPAKKKPKAAAAPAATPPDEEPAPPAPTGAAPNLDEAAPPSPTPPPEPAAEPKAAHADTAEDAKAAPKDGAAKGSAYDEVDEKPDVTYIYLGARYRGTIIPKFLLNLFVNEGATIYSNSFSLEADIRRNGFSIIPALSYVEYGTGDILFWQKGSPDIPQNYSLVNSSMKAIYASVDLLWSTKLAKGLELEYGGGVGIGTLFGDLEVNWVYENANGPLTASNGNHYAACQAGGHQGGCNTADHQNATVAKTGGYMEPSWINGGSKPNFFPSITIPQIGLRWKPIPQLETRLNVGFSLTGFFFGFGGAYGVSPSKG